MKKFLLATLLAAMMATVPAYAEAPEAASSVSAGDGPSIDTSERNTSNKLILKKGQHPAKQGRPLDLDITVGANWWNADLGLFFDIPIVPNGFSPLNDSFDLEIGTYAGLSWYYGGGEVVSFTQDILVGVRYSLYLTPQWTVYIRSLFGVGYWANKYDNGNKHNVFFAWDESIGAYWNFSKNVGMRFDVGYHGVNVGIAFKFGSVGASSKN